MAEPKTKPNEVPVADFLNALPDGPVRFHFPGPSLEEDLRLRPSRPSAKT